MDNYNTSENDTQQQQFDNSSENQNNMEQKKIASDEVLLFLKAKNYIYYFLGVIEVLLLFRLLFKSLGANPNSAFTAFVYGITAVLIAPFSGIFNIIAPGGTTNYIIEPATILAIFIYAIITYGIIKLIRISLLDEHVH